MDGQVALVAPPAPAGTRSASAAPTISPSVNTIHVAPGAPYNLCIAVRDDTTSSWKVFFFLLTCRTYSVSNWLGEGTYRDNQTGGVRSFFFGRSGNPLASFTPDGGIRHSFD